MDLESLLAEIRKWINERPIVAVNPEDLDAVSHALRDQPWGFRIKTSSSVQRGTAYVVDQPAIVLPHYEFYESFSFTKEFEFDGTWAARIDNIDNIEIDEVKRD